MSESAEQPTPEEFGIELTILSNRYREAVLRDVLGPEAALESAERVQFILGDLQALLNHVSTRLHECRHDAQPGLLGPTNGIEASTAASVRLLVAAGQARQCGAAISQARAQAAYLTWPRPDAPLPPAPSVRELMSDRAAALDTESDCAPDASGPQSGPTLA